MKWERDRGRIGKVLESGSELGMSVAQWHCMSRAAHKAICADSLVFVYLFIILAIERLLSITKNNNNL